jgi:septal ring factor EnvC (AmiA/AmiB activator)
MKSSPSFFAIALFCILSSLFSPALFSQDFSSIERDLSELESLITDTLANSEEQQKQLDALRKNLAESGELIGNYESIIAERENLLKDLQARLNEMSETYRTQSALSAKYERSSKFWKTFTLIAVPTAAIISGGLVWALK